MTAVKKIEFVTRSERQATERKYWVLEAADYLIELGMFATDEAEEAQEYAARLAYRNTDEGGELMESVKDCVEDDLAYAAS